MCGPLSAETIALDENAEGDVAQQAAERDAPTRPMRNRDADGGVGGAKRLEVQTHRRREARRSDHRLKQRLVARGGRVEIEGRAAAHLADVHAEENVLVGTRVQPLRDVLNHGDAVAADRDPVFHENRDHRCLLALTMSPPRVIEHPSRAGFFEKRSKLSSLPCASFSSATPSLTPRAPRCRTLRSRRSGSRTRTKRSACARTRSAAGSTSCGAARSAGST